MHDPQSFLIKSHKCRRRVIVLGQCLTAGPKRTAVPMGSNTISIEVLQELLRSTDLKSSRTQEDVTREEESETGTRRLKIDTEDCALRNALVAMINQQASPGKPQGAAVEVPVEGPVPVVAPAEKLNVVIVLEELLPEAQPATGTQESDETNPTPPPQKNAKNVQVQELRSLWDKSRVQTHEVRQDRGRRAAMVW
jgi:hypothetical protein